MIYFVYRKPGVLFRMLFAVLLNPPLIVTMITLLHAIHQVELPSSGACIFDQNIKLLDIECDCCNVEFNIGVNTVVIINGGETQRVTRNVLFFSDHFFYC